MTADENPGRGVVVTGAARGMGKAIAQRFAASGHVVIGVDRDADALAATFAEVVGQEQRGVAQALGPPRQLGPLLAVRGSVGLDPESEPTRMAHGRRLFR